MKFQKKIEIYSLIKNTKYLFAQVKQYGRNSLFVRNLKIVISLLLVVLIINGVNYYTTIQKNINNEIESNNIYLLERVKDMGVNVLKTAETIATNTAIQSSSMQYCLSEHEDVAKSYEEAISKFIRSYTLVYNYIDSVYLVSKNGNRVTDGDLFATIDSFYDSEFIQSIVNLDDITCIPRYKKDYYPELITIVRPVNINGYIDETPDNIVGHVCVNIKAKEFGKILNSMDKTDKKFFNIILVNEGKILYSGDFDDFGKKTSDVSVIKDIKSFDEKLTYQTTSESGKLIVSSISSSFGGYSFVSITPAADKFEIFIQTLRYIGLGMLLILLISIIAAMLIAYVSYQPIIDISNLLGNEQDVTKGILPFRERSGEMKYISENIAKNLRRNEEMAKELQDRVLLFRRAMFTALQVQINPHFLYNTLENINWLAVNLSGGPNEVSSSVLALSKLMRYSSETEGYLVTIDEEIRHAKQYVELLELRYPDLFTVEWNVEETALQSGIIRLTLQPLIENAVRHGIRPKRAKGRIVISITKQGEKISIVIKDDGVGMTKEDVKLLNQNLLTNYLLESKHVGLRNVNQRFKIIFGEKYGVRVEDSSIGFALTIIVPDFNPHEFELGI